MLSGAASIQPLRSSFFSAAGRGCRLIRTIPRYAFGSASYFPAIQKRALSSVSQEQARSRVVHEVNKFVGKKHIIWAQHPGRKNVQNSSSYWSAKVSIADNWGTDYFERQILPLCPKEEKRGFSKGSLPNHFMQWLAGDTKFDLSHRIFNQEAPVFLNCVDFVYQCYFNAGLITKGQIVQRYEEEIDAYFLKKATESAGNPRSTYYGLDLERRKELETIRPGDVIMVTDRGDPAHVCLYCEGEQVASLWNIKPKIEDGWDVVFDSCYNPVTIPFDDFVHMCYRGFGSPLGVSKIDMDDVLKGV